MEFIKEYLDENTNEVILEFNATKEEREILEKKCKELNLSLNEYINKTLETAINNPKEFKQWIKENRDDKNNVGTIGKPIYKRGDKTGFYITPHKKDEEIFCIGTIEIIDAYGTFEQNEEPSYDILVENFDEKGPCLVKHVRESSTYNINKN